MVNGSDELAYVAGHLSLAKKRRIFKILHWYRDRQKLLKSAESAIRQQQSQSLRCKFFFQWRTQYMEANLVQTYLHNK